MKTFNLIFLALLISIPVCAGDNILPEPEAERLPVVSSSSRKINSQYFETTLEEFTAMELPLVADQATRLIFPFVLDNQEFKPVVKYSVKPDEVFSISVAEDVKGQNILILENSQSPDDVLMLFDENYNYTPILGQFFLSVNGYNISVKLTTSANPSDQFANIVFDLSEEERQHLIDVEIDRHKAELDRILESERANLDEVARKHAVKYLADVILEEPGIKRIRTNLNSDDRDINFYVEQIERYSDLYYAIRFEIRNESADVFRFTSIDNFLVDDGSVSALEGWFSCKGEEKRGATRVCVYVTDRADLFTAKKVRTVIDTDHGKQWVFTW